MALRCRAARGSLDVGIDILGIAATGARLGMLTAYYLRIGDNTAMLLLGVVMLHCSYGSKVSSVRNCSRDV